MIGSGGRGAPAGLQQGRGLCSCVQEQSLCSRREQPLHYQQDGRVQEEVSALSSLITAQFSARFPSAGVGGGCAMDGPLNEDGRVGIVASAKETILKVRHKLLGGLEGDIEGGV